MPHAAVAAITVNYNTSALTLACVRSLREQEVSVPDGSHGVEVLVVDNASRSEERARLDCLGDAVVWNEENVGYGRAINETLASTRANLILFTNADTRYRPGALQALADELLRSPSCGAAGPRLQWDDAGEMLLPPNVQMTPWRTLAATAASGLDVVARARERRWVRSAIRHWTARQPLTQQSLSGASLMTRRDVLGRVGGFDERFHLYFEDTDWCRRIGRAGYELKMVPAALVAHYYDQSAQQDRTAAVRAFANSRAAYLEKHHPAHARLIGRRLEHRLASPAPAATTNSVAVGRLHEAPQLSALDVTDGPSLFLLSPHASCIPAIGAFTPAPQLAMPAEPWARLAPGRYHARLLSADGRRIIRRWSWEKEPDRVPSGDPDTTSPTSRP